MNGITLFSIVLTIAAYCGAMILSRKVPSPLTSPVMTSTAAIILVLSLMDIDYEDYTPAKEWMTFLLGPATVALALPLYKARKILIKRFKSIMAGLFTGTLTTIFSAVLLSKALGLSEGLQAAAAVKAVTSPVAIEAALLIGGNPAIAVAFVMAAGIFGAVFGPLILTVARITDPFARGLGIGTVSHGIGTGQVMKEGALQGAASSIGMGMAAVITSLILPWLYPLIK
ncbi:LrgB family protein [Neobacillus piezotolerans]|uniref:LrgB family protein n=1 Tax=Neobacillus piezotolerans TaxID=2259171 RepID=A0A3D8GP17_9BACI|nr:LrgB family protein [Neobacillus piezotolerans]RDU36031.1 LrgB family protein [Neobacillus piezotolerans]